MQTIQQDMEQIRREMERGRGGQTVHSFPIEIEPCFTSFKLADAVSTNSATEGDLLKKRNIAKVMAISNLITVTVKPAREDQVAPQRWEQFVTSLSAAMPISFEVVTHSGKVTLQFAVSSRDADILTSQLNLIYPGAEVYKGKDQIQETAGGQTIVVAYRLERSHFFTLNTGLDVDPLVFLLGALASFGPSERGGLQIVFLRARGDWRSNILAASRNRFDPSSSPFRDLPQLPKLAEQKVASPLSAVSLRLWASQARLIPVLEGFLKQFEGANSFSRLTSDYPLASLAQRTVHSTGMILNARELSSLVHVPGLKGFSCPKMETASLGTPPPALALNNRLFSFGVNSYRGINQEVGISEEWLTRHCAIFGATGTGKTTFLSHLVSLVAKGYGLALIDPNGDAVKKFLSLVPEHRARDCVYFNPADRDYPPALNILDSSNEREREMLCSDLLVCLRRYFADSWGDRLEWILRQAIKSLLLSQGHKTLRDIPRMMLDETYRHEILNTVSDPDALEFWQKHFTKLPRGAVDPILNKLSKFVDSELIRNIVSQPNLIDFHKLLKENKVLLADLGKGLIGEDNASLLGSFLLSKLQIATLARAETPMHQRKLFTIVIDELHNFADDRANVTSLKSFLSEARKYRVALVLATQYPSQLHREIAAAIFGNVGTLMILRSGATEAQVIQKELGNFTTEDIQRLQVGEALVRMGGSESTFNVKIYNSAKAVTSQERQIIAHSRSTYCRTREEVLELLKVAKSVSQQAIPVEHATMIKPEPVTQQEKRFLEFVGEHPQLSLTEIYRQLDLSGYMGTKLKKTLLEKGMVTEVTLSFGQAFRPPTVLLLTRTGYEAVGLQVKAGRGGPLHRYIQAKIKQQAEGRGYSADIESYIPDTGQRVDVALHKDNVRVAVEIAVISKVEHEFENITKCLGAGYDKVLAVFTDSELLQEVRAFTQSRLQAEEMDKVKFYLFPDFEL
jgi:DNA-binding MarR family transcriptional regulator/ribosomal protein S24E